MRVGVGVVERGVADGEGGGCGEDAIGGAEVGDGGAAFVVLGGVGDGHVFFDYGNVFLTADKCVRGIIGEVGIHDHLRYLFRISLRCGELHYGLFVIIGHDYSCVSSGC